MTTDYGYDYDDGYDDMLNADADSDDAEDDNIQRIFFQPFVAAALESGQLDKVLLPCTNLIVMLMMTMAIMTVICSCFKWGCTTFVIF